MRYIILIYTSYSIVKEEEKERAKRIESIKTPQRKLKNKRRNKNKLWSAKSLLLRKGMSGIWSQRSNPQADSVNLSEKLVNLDE